MSRRLKTLMWLTGATLVGLSTEYFNVLPMIFIPLLFGLGVNFSNDDYMKYKFSEWTIPIAFMLIFLWATVPFYMIGGLIFDNKFGATFFGAIGTFLLVSLTLKITLKQIQLGYLQMCLIVILAFVAVYLHAYFTGQSIDSYKKGILERVDLTVIIYHSFMILIILSMLTDSQSKKRA